jgi:hypothetical protein
MANFFIDFEWFRCLDGYRFTSYPAAFPGQNWTDHSEMVARNSWERSPYRPFDEPGGGDLYLIFAHVRTTEGLMEFIQRFGPLTTAFGEPIPWALRRAKFFRDLLKFNHRPKQLASFFNATKRKWAIASNESQGITDYGEIKEEDFKEMIGSIDLLADPIKGVRLRFTPHTLIDAMWWQLGQCLTGNISFGECRHCGRWFETGPGTGKHVDAEFCCNQHKVRYFSLARSKRNRTQTRGD